MDNAAQGKDGVDGTLHAHLLVATGEHTYSYNGALRKRDGHRLVLATHDRAADTYSYHTMHSDAVRCFSRIGHRFAEQDLRASWSIHRTLLRDASTDDQRDGFEVYTDLGYVGDPGCSRLRP